MSGVTTTLNSSFEDSAAPLTGLQSVKKEPVLLDIVNHYSKHQKHPEDGLPIPYPTRTFQPDLLIKDIERLPSIEETGQPPKSHFALLQEWEGYVLDISLDSFTATLYDVTEDRGLADEEAEFPLDELSELDKRLLKPGAVFRWLIGYRIKASGKERTSRLVFRDLPHWRQKDFIRLESKAQEISDSLKWV